jgi:hypothetical protein
VLTLLAHPLTMLAQTPVLAHAMTSNVWELLALVGPFGIVFGAGVLLVIGPIVRSQGERYQHREIRPEEVRPHTNGTSKSTASLPRQDSAEGHGGVVAAPARGDESRN